MTRSSRVSGLPARPGVGPVRLGDRGLVPLRPLVQVPWCIAALHLLGQAMLALGVVGLWLAGAWWIMLGLARFGLLDVAAVVYVGYAAGTIWLVKRLKL